MQSKTEVRAQLQREINALQGYKPAPGNQNTDSSLSCIAAAFPHSSFPFAAIHELCCNSREQFASASAFITALLSGQLKKDGIICWVSASRILFPPSLQQFGINPNQVFFVDIKRPKDIAGAVEEALTCNALSTVVAELPQLDFTQSRRMQLKIESSGVGCFMLRYQPRNLTTVSTARWQISSLPSRSEAGLPGIGFPCWQVDLLKVKNGRPGSWQLEWSGNRLRHVSKLVSLPQELKRKTV